MKQYFIRYYRDFENTYDLCWAETQQQLSVINHDGGWKRIPCKRAIRLCIEERDRRKHDKQNSGYAPIYIFSINHQICDYRNGTTDGYSARDGYVMEQNTI